METLRTFRLPFIIIGLLVVSAMFLRAVPMRPFTRQTVLVESAVLENLVTKHWREEALSALIDEETEPGEVVVDSGFEMMFVERPRVSGESAMMRVEVRVWSTGRPAGSEGTDAEPERTEVTIPYDYTFRRGRDGTWAISSAERLDRTL